MVMWPEAIDRISAGQPHDLGLRPRSRLGFGGIPLAIAGRSGAGKTEIWSRLTLDADRRGMSTTTDDGYMLHRNKRALALTTIPGQISRNRHEAMTELFGAHTMLNGVVFVVSNGYDHIWPRSADSAASELQQFDLVSLTERNRRHELSNFDEICREIANKKAVAPREWAPKWLLVVVNKLDLYWPDVKKAEDYYLPQANSPFNERAQELLDQIGRSSLDYHVIPLATRPLGYQFRTSRGSLTAPSQLNDDACSASVLCLIETLEELCGL